MPVKTEDGRTVAWVHPKASVDSPARRIAEALRKAPPPTPTSAPSREDYFPESAEWGRIPGFIPEDGEWPEAARKKQEQGFLLGCYRVLKFPRQPGPVWAQPQHLPGASGGAAPKLSDLGACFPYFVLPGFELYLARILLALNDDRVPKLVKKRLKIHLRDILRWDGFLYDARPLPLPRHPPRIPPETKTAVPSIYAGVRVLCRETLGPSGEQICELIRRRLPAWNEQIQRREELERVLSTRPWKKLKPHETAKKIMSHVFGISDKYVRLLIYGQ